MKKLSIGLMTLLLLAVNEKGKTVEPSHPDLVSYQFVESEVYLTRIWISPGDKQEPYIIEAEFATEGSEFFRKKAAGEINLEVFRGPFFDDNALYLSHLPRVEWNHGKKEEELVAEVKKRRASDLNEKLLSWVFSKMPLEEFKQTLRHDFFNRAVFYVFPTADTFKLKATLLESEWRSDTMRHPVEEETHLIDLKL